MTSDCQKPRWGSFPRDLGDDRSSSPLPARWADMCSWQHMADMSWYPAKACSHWTYCVQTSEAFWAFCLIMFSTIQHCPRGFFSLQSTARQKLFVKLQNVSFSYFQLTSCLDSLLVIKACLLLISNQNQQDKLGSWCRCAQKKGNLSSGPLKLRTGNLKVVIPWSFRCFFQTLFVKSGTSELFLNLSMKHVSFIECLVSAFRNTSKKI